MTNQQLFAKVVNAVLVQGKPSLGRIPGREKVACAYRGTDGLKCVAGHAIPDDKYIPEMEGKQAYQVQEAYPDRVEWTAEQNSLMRALQSCHDANAYEPDFTIRFHRSARVLAQALGLTFF
jgi:hypothetical protein